MKKKSIEYIQTSLRLLILRHVITYIIRERMQIKDMHDDDNFDIEEDTIEDVQANRSKTIAYQYYARDQHTLLNRTKNA